LVGVAFHALAGHRRLDGRSRASHDRLLHTAPGEGGREMSEVLTRAAVIVGQVLLLWVVLACLGAAVWAGYARNKRRERRRQEALSRAYEWARAHGGDPEYGGNLRGRAP